MVEQKSLIKKKCGRKKNPEKKPKYTPTGNPVGRPTIYNKKIADEILERIMMGEGLNEILKDKKMPSYRTVMEWLRPGSSSFNSEFLRFYRLAREAQADWLADEARTIVRDRDEDVNSRRLALDYVKWRAQHLKPKVYSDKVQLTGRDGEDLIPTRKIIEIHPVSVKNNNGEEKK